MRSIAGPDSLQIGLSPWCSRRDIRLEGLDHVGRRPRRGRETAPTGLDDGKPHIVRSEQKGALRVGQRTLGHGGLLFEHSALRPHAGNFRVEIRHDEAHVIERTSCCRRWRSLRVSGHEQPNVVEQKAVDPALEASRLATDHARVPGERRLGIARAHMDVVKAQTVRVFHELDSCSPRIEDEAELEQTGHIVKRSSILEPLQPDASAADSDGFERGHLCLEVGNRESDVIHACALRSTEYRLGEKNDLDALTLRRIVAICDGSAIEMIGVPLDGLERARRGNMNVVEVGGPGSSRHQCCKRSRDPADAAGETHLRHGVITGHFGYSSSSAVLLRWP
jgi:hypothetical protein